MSSNKVNICVMQRVCTTYRLPLLNKVCESMGFAKLHLLIGDDLPNSKVKSTKNISAAEFEVIWHRASFLNLGKRLLVWHRGLIKTLRRLKPEIIVCEGESHLLGYLSAIFYRRFFDPKVKLVLWTLGALPGEDSAKGIKRVVKKYLYKAPNAVITYSSYGKQRLTEYGVDEHIITPAVNICDTQGHLSSYFAHKADRALYRKSLNVEGQFLVLYVGDIGPNKNIDTLVMIAKLLEHKGVVFKVVGDGNYLKQIADKINQLGLNNIEMVGRVTKDLHQYYIASDVFLLPGRGGMVIGEAMCYGLPVLLHAADGTEYDFIENGIDGYILQDNTANSFAEKIEVLSNNKKLLSDLSSNAAEKMKSKLSMDKTALSISTLLEKLEHQNNANI